jgi:hypothetical protein
VRGILVLRGGAHDRWDIEVSLTIGETIGTPEARAYI